MPLLLYYAIQIFYYYYCYYYYYYYYNYYFHLCRASVADPSLMEFDDGRTSLWQV